MSELTQGRRRHEDTKPWELEAGDYTVRDGVAWVCLPSGVGPSRLKGWDLIEHDDGTITISPSILDSGTPNGWHGFLERGVWRSC
jgi:hypothetical protein